MEHGGDLAHVGRTGLLLDHAGQGQDLIHGEAHFRRRILGVRREGPLRLGQQLADDVLVAGGDVHLVGVGGQVALQDILALRHAGGGQHVRNVVIILEGFARAAQRQEALLVGDHTVLVQLVREVLNRPAGDHGDVADDGVAVALRQLIGDLLHGHGAVQLVGAGLDLLAHTGEVAVVLEHRLAADEPGLLQVGGHAGQALAAFHGEGHSGGVLQIRGSQELSVHGVPAGGQQSRHHQQRCQTHQQGPQQPPQPAVPVGAVLPLVPHGTVGIVALVSPQGGIPPSGQGAVSSRRAAACRYPPRR